MARIANGMSLIISKVCTTFGKAFTSQIVEKQFSDVLSKDSFTKSTKELQIARMRLTPVYLLGVLTSISDNELHNHLKILTMNVAEQESGWSHDHFNMLKDSIRLLCTSANKTPQVVTLLTRDLIASPISQVRAMIVRLYEDLMSFLSAQDLEEKLLPALLTLCTDVDMIVRLASIKQLCNVALIITQKDLVEKIDKQVELLIKNGTHEINCELIREFSRIIPAVNTQFRDVCILPKLITLVDKNNHNKNVDQRTEGCKMILEAYKSFNGCVITQETIQMYIVPGLRLLQANSNVMDTSFKNTATRMLTDMEKVIGGAGTPTTPTRDDPKKKGWGLKWGNNTPAQ